MIENTLKTEFIAGTNLQGDMVSADWRFLLPRLKLDRVLCLGLPGSASLAVLAATADEIIVSHTSQSGLDQLQAECVSRELSNFQFLRVDSFENLSDETTTFPLVLLLDSGLTAEFLQDEKVQLSVSSLLADDGILKYEVSGFGQARSKKRKAGMTRVYWLTPLTGEMRTALPTGCGKISKFFFDNVLYGQSWKKRLLSRVGSMVSSAGMVDSVMPRKLCFLHNSTERADNSCPPHFLRKMARTAGLNFDGQLFGLSTRGKFNANKVIYYLFEPGASTPQAIVKMTRSPEFNHRLENEYKTLDRLAKGRFVAPETFPQPLFFDYHNGLAVLAQKAVSGAPFRTRTSATPDCHLAQSAIDWIAQLAASSVDSGTTTCAEAGANLRVLYDRFSATYSLSAAEKSFMQDQLARLENSSGQFPTVFQHGDPGTWNILVSDSDEIIFIDWEAGEDRGMPLWDLFYFMRTYASWVERSKGNKDALENFSNSFLQQSAIADWLACSVQMYCSKIGLQPELVEPLFYTCWMHRSLKESTRLQEAQLGGGHFVNLLKTCIAQRQEPALAGLFRSETGYSCETKIIERDTLAYE